MEFFRKKIFETLLISVHLEPEKFHAGFHSCERDSGDEIIGVCRNLDIIRQHLFEMLHEIGKLAPRITVDNHMAGFPGVCFGAYRPWICAVFSPDSPSFSLTPVAVSAVSLPKRGA